ncbi:MAG: zinc ribbon domain-containing protein [Thermoleophilaceae bacterium]
MPLYEFDCAACGARFEELAPAGVAVTCPACGGERVTRAFSPIAPPRVPVGLTGAAARDSDARRREREAQKKERFVAERKRKRGEGPPGA